MTQSSKNGAGRAADPSADARGAPKLGLPKLGAVWRWLFDRQTLRSTTWWALYWVGNNRGRMLSAFSSVQLCCLLNPVS